MSERVTRRLVDYGKGLEPERPVTQKPNEPDDHFAGRQAVDSFMKGTFPTIVLGKPPEKPAQQSDEK